MAAYAPASRPALPASAAAALNAKLRSMIPGGDITYENTQLVGDLRAAILRAEADYLGKLAPPPEVLRKAIAVVYGRRTGSSPDSVTYILAKHRILGFQICTGWRVVAHPIGGGPPEGGYVFGPCGGDTLDAPPWATITLPPHPSPTPTKAP